MCFEPGNTWVWFFFIMLIFTFLKKKGTCSAAGLNPNSLELPAGLQLGYVIFKRAVELKAFSGAFNPQRAGWQGCRSKRRQAGIILYTDILIFRINRDLFDLNIAVLPLDKHSCCDWKQVSIFHQGQAAETYRTVDSAAEETGHTLKRKRTIRLSGCLLLLSAGIRLEYDKIAWCSWLVAKK